MNSIWGSGPEQVRWLTLGLVYGIASLRWAVRCYWIIMLDVFWDVFTGCCHMPTRWLRRPTSPGQVLLGRSIF